MPPLAILARAMPVRRGAGELPVAAQPGGDDDLRDAVHHGEQAGQQGERGYARAGPGRSLRDQLLPGQLRMPASRHNHPYVMTCPAPDASSATTMRASSAREVTPSLR